MEKRGFVIVVPVLLCTSTFDENGYGKFRKVYERAYGLGISRENDNFVFTYTFTTSEEA